MKYILHKYSSPGWSEEFLSEAECRRELYKHLCSDCREGDISYIGYGGEIVVESRDEPVYEDSDIDDMLDTGCGCEYGYTELDTDQNLRRNKMTHNKEAIKNNLEILLAAVEAQPEELFDLHQYAKTTKCGTLFCTAGFH